MRVITIIATPPCFCCLLNVIKLLFHKIIVFLCLHLLYFGKVDLLNSSYLNFQIGYPWSNYNFRSLKETKIANSLYSILAMKRAKKKTFHPCIKLKLQRSKNMLKKTLNKKNFAFDLSFSLFSFVLKWRPIKEVLFTFGLVECFFVLFCLPVDTVEKLRSTYILCIPNSHSLIS